jgi:hypothetical protein
LEEKEEVKVWKTAIEGKLVEEKGCQMLALACRKPRMIGAIESWGWGTKALAALVGGLVAGLADHS